MNFKEKINKCSSQIFNKKNNIFIALLSVAFLIWLGVIFFGSSLYVDEKIHDRQINRFFKGNYDLLSNLTTIPGYHIVMASVSKIFNNHSSQQTRLISLAFSLLSIWFFYLLSKKIDSENPTEKTLQYIFLPITFFYFPLIYTDIFSLLLILIAFYFSLSRRYKSSALFSLLSVLVRQNNILWVAFIWVYSYIQEYGFSFSIEKIKAYISRTISYIIVFILFLLFVFFNKGVAVGEQERHQVGFYFGNLYFFLFLVSVLFFPILLSHLKKIKKTDLTKVYLGLGLGFLFAFIFIIFPPAIHRYNLNMKFLRNIILHLAYTKYTLVYAFLIISGSLTIFLMKFKNQALLLFPFIAIYLSQSFLVEQRYSIIPLAFMLLFRQPQKDKSGAILIAYFSLLSIGLIFMLLKLKIFF